jgi:hypothetical protein
MELRSKASLAGIAVILWMGMAAIAAPVSLQFDGNAFRVNGWKPPSAVPAGGWASVFTVYAGAGDVPALLGAYAVEQDTLVFRPKFPIAAGVKYRAIFRQPGAAPIEKTFEGPPRETTPRARVDRVYPSAEELPSNQLRLYIYFSAPMSRGGAAQYIHILDENGSTLQGSQAVFLPNQELWDPNFKRLTMTFDPGRIKRGLTANERMGPPIAAGKQYTLVIDKEWPDARGVPMVEGFRKSFRGGPAQRIPPDPKLWRITPPKSGTLDILLVDFPTPMNYPLLQRMIQVVGPSAGLVGTVSIMRQESEWGFTPRDPWKAGDYRLVINTGLEDLAGNHIGQPFDIDTFEKVTERITTETVSVPFRIR